MRAKSIIEVLLVFTLTSLLGWALRLTEFLRWEIDILGWSYLGSFLLILIPVFILVLARRNFESYGLTVKGWRHQS